MATIMVVDDAAFMRMRCSKLLSDNGYEVIEASTGGEAVKLFQMANPDGVLMDVTMPDMDGLRALQEIRGKSPGARVALITAMGRESIVREAMRLGVNDFVVKPFSTERLLAAARKLAGSGEASVNPRPEGQP
ncbi:MAG: response regulator [Dehalococcoidia bacterium]